VLWFAFAVAQDEAQLIAADELCARGWWWHKKFRCWFIHAPNNPVVKNATARSERGTYLFFDTSIWDVVQVCFVFVLFLPAGYWATVH
jgi:CCR4-NOT transcription complex subunit 2